MRDSTDELILLVEDDPVVVRFALDQLEEAGRTVVTAKTVKEAADFVAHHSPTLLLTDYSLPDGTGEDLLETLAGYPTGYPPFIVMTGAGDERIAVEMLKRGARDYLIKTPDFFHELPLSVNRVLRELRTEEQLRQAQQTIFSREEQLRCAFEQAAVGMAFSELDGRLLGFNSKYQQMLGLTDMELAAASYQTVTHPDDRLKQQALTKMLLAGEIPSFELEKRYLRKDGSVVWANTTVTLIRDHNGAPAQLFAVVEDLTWIRRKNQRLEQLQQQLIKAQQIGKIYSFEWDLADGHIDWSPQTYLLLERSPDSIEQTIRQWFTFVHPEDRQQLQEAIDKVMHSGETQVEYRLAMPDGRYKPVITFGDVKRDASGKPVSIFGITQDLTERRSFEENLCAALTRAETSNRAKSEFLANMSHELRTPLNGILGMLQLLEDGPLDEEQCEYIRIASISGWTLLRLLEDLLDLSRIEAGRMLVREKPLDLHECLGTVLELFRYKASEKGVGLTQTIEAGVPAWILGDDVRIRQILFNLVGNAVKFTHTGEIAVSLRSSEEAGEGRQRLVLEVSDTGIGMSEEMLSKIGEPFTQDEEAYRRTFQGAGLGLSIVKRLATLMGGELSVTSQAGHGTRVKVILEVGCCATPPNTSSIT